MLAQLLACMYLADVSVINMLQIIIENCSNPSMNQLIVLDGGIQVCYTNCV
jgi:hypothetical protein